MRSASMSQWVYTVALLGAGLGLGWWLGHPPPAPQTAEPKASQTQRAHPQREPVARPVTPEPQLPGADEPEPTAQADSLARFRALLEARSFESALDLYQRIERRNPERMPAFKEILLGVMETYLRGDRDQALTSLVDAFLARYYDDIDVLLVLARQQTQAGYYLEATQSLQLAQSYALARPGEQPKLDEALHQFVQSVDQRLAATQDWQALLHFYDRLQQLGLAQPEHRLRQAGLQLHRGDPELGRQMLQRLAQDPGLAARANALLEQNRAPTHPPPDPRHSTFQDSIPLGIAGGHFHLPVRFNDSRDLNLIIDTGASLTTLSRDSFERLDTNNRFTQLGHQLFNTAGGPVQGQIYRVDRVRLGRQQLTNVRIAVLDFNLPDSLDGLLGMNFLQHFRFEVDQEQQQLHLQPR